MYRPHWYDWKTYQLSKPFDERFSDIMDNPCDKRRHEKPFGYWKE